MFKRHFVPNLDTREPMCGALSDDGTLTALPSSVACEDCREAMRTEATELQGWERELMHGTDWFAGRTLASLR